MIRYLTPDEAAGELLGWTGRRRGQALLRIVLRKERGEKREIAVRVHGEQRTRYHLTEPMLRLHFPELFQPTVGAMAQELCKKIDELKSTIGAQIDERVAPQIQHLRNMNDRLTSSVSSLAQSTNDGFTRLERRIRAIEKSPE